MTARGLSDYGVPEGTWMCDYHLGDAGQLVSVYGREFSHRPGVVSLSAWIDPTLIELERGAKPDRLRNAAQQLTEAAQMIDELVTKVAPWWHSAPNPACRPWCTTEHNPDVFADGALFACRAYVDHDLAVIDAIEINACTRADETAGARPGDLIFDPPEIEVFMMTDGRDGDVTTPEGLEAMAAQLPTLLAEARAIAASDPHATDEQKAVAR